MKTDWSTINVKLRTTSVVVQKKKKNSNFIFRDTIIFNIVHLNLHHVHSRTICGTLIFTSLYCE